MSYWFQVASALSDPYLSFAAALNGLAGPLHGLANQVWYLLSLNVWSWNIFICALRRLLLLFCPLISLIMWLQEVLLWIKSVVDECGENITIEQLKEYVWKTLKGGKVSNVLKFSHLSVEILSNLKSAWREHMLSCLTLTMGQNM